MKTKKFNNKMLSPVSIEPGPLMNLWFHCGKTPMKTWNQCMFILQVRVKRLTRSQSAFVEFKLDKARPSKGYEFDVTFRDIGENRLPRQRSIHNHRFL